MRPISLAELRLLAQGRRWLVDQPIAGLKSLTAVKGELTALHHLTALEITARAETIVTLCCDRCLQHFNHALQADVHELIELRRDGHDSSTPDDGSAVDPLEADQMVVGFDLDDRLDPLGQFDPERWLFEQLTLQLPLVNRCGRDCPGPACWSSEPSGIDPRWAALASLGSGTPAASDPADSTAKED
ncbi:MAG: YceD family protein [Cyanobium sp.]